MQQDTYKYIFYDPNRKPAAAASEQEQPAQPKTPPPQTEEDDEESKEQAKRREKNNERLEQTQMTLLDHQVKRSIIDEPSPENII